MTKDMTDEEYDALDELLTRTTPKLSDGPQRGFFTERKKRMAGMTKEEQTVTLDNLSFQWLRAKAAASKKTPTEIIGDLVREKISVSA